MAANHNAGANGKSRPSSTMDEQMGDTERGGEEDFSFAHFERQWRRYLANFERRRLQYADFYYGHKETLCGLELNSSGHQDRQDMQDMQFQDAVDAAANALYDAQYNMGEEYRCCNCNCNCKGQNPNGRRLSSTPR